MKTLYLMRHAKSSWDMQGLTDSERTLNARRKKNARFMGKLLMEMKEIPDLIVTSTAKRAYSTVKKFARKIDYSEKKILKEKKMYMADRDEFLSVIKNNGHQVKKLMLISHNPGITNFANEISGEDIENIPTAGILRLDFDIESWKDIKDKKG